MNPVDLSTYKDVDVPNDLSSGDWVDMEETSPNIDTKTYSIDYGFHTPDKIKKAFDDAVTATVSYFPKVEQVPSLIPGEKTGVPNIPQFVSRVAGGVASPVFKPEMSEEIYKFTMDTFFTRPMAALTALSVETPFAENDKGIWDTIVKGFSNPQEYTPDRMTEELVNSGMEPVSAASLATLGQFGFYLGMGRAFTSVVTKGKIDLLNKSVNNIAKAVQESRGVSGTTVTLKPEIAQAIAKNTDVASVVDIYCKSRNLKLYPNTGQVRIVSTQIPKDIRTFEIQAAKEPIPGKAIPTPVKAGITPIIKDLKGGIAPQGGVIKPTIEERLAKVEQAQTELDSGKDITEYLLANKIQRYKGGYMAEELAELPSKYVTTDKNANKIDETLGDLRSRGYDFKTTKDLIDYLVQHDARVKELKTVIELNKPQKVTKFETTILKEKLQNIDRGIREGKVIAQEEIKSIQGDIVKLLKTSDLEAKDREKFLTTVKNIQTPEQFTKALPSIINRMARLEVAELKRGVKADIEKELKYTRPTKEGQKTVGRYDYESNKFFEDMRTVSKLSQEKAQAMLDAMPTEGLSELDLIKARGLSLKANGMDASLELHNQVLADIKNLKTLGEASKDDADFEKRIGRKERVAGLVDAVNIITGSKDTIMTNIVNTYRLGFSNTYSLLNSIAGKNIAEAYDPEVKENTRDTAIFDKTKEIATRSAEIFGLKSPAQITEKLQDMAGEKFVLTDIEGLTSEVTKLDIIDVYNSLKNELVAERYYNAFGAQQVNELVSNLTDSDKQFGDYLQATVQDYREILNQRHIEITGRDLGYVENYWPATSEYQPDMFDDMRVQGETPSALKARSVSSKVFPVPQDAWMKAQKHIVQAEHVKELSREHEMLKRLFSDRHVKNAIENKFGERVYRDLLDRIEYISLNKVTQQVDAVSKVFGKMMANWVAAKIANPTVFARQLVSVINYAETMPVGKWSVGFGKGLLSPKETFDFMWKNAPFLEARFNRGYSEALKEAIKGAESMHSSLHRDFLHGLTSLTRSGDIGAIIYGGYPYVMHLMETMPIKEAMKQFEAVTLKSQQSGVTSGLSPFQNTANPIARILLAFKNTSSQYLRKQVDAIISYNNGDISAAQLAKTTVIYSIINPLLYLGMGAVAGTAFWKLLGKTFRGEPLEEINMDEAWGGIAAHLIASPFNAIPLIDDIAQWTGRKLTGQKSYKVFSTPMMDDLETAFSKMGKKDITFMDYIETFGSVAEVTTGAPIKTGVRIYKNLAGEKKQKKKVSLQSPL